MLKKNKISKFIFSSLFLFQSNNLFAYKFVIVTDQENPTKANEVKELFLKTYPFNQFELDFEIKTVAKEKLNCQSMPDIERNVGCSNRDEIARMGAEAGANQVFVVKDMDKYGGSGGPIPVMTTHSQSDNRMMIHEYLHTLGLCDEYKYSASESEYYCKESGANMAIITPNPNGYQNDGDARTQHMGKIPWAQDILETTKITHEDGKKLGTDALSSNVTSARNETNSPTTLGAAIGLYEGQTCAEATPKVYTWNPGREVTIMDKLSAGIGRGNEAIVMRALESRGARKKLNPPPRESIVVNDSTVNKNIEESSTINNLNSSSISK